METNNKKLILEFFKDYKSTEKDNILNISKAPKQFEEIYGKKAPYKLVFSLNKHNEIHGSELITKGSYFLSSMKEYMDDKGQTSAIKLNIKTPPTTVNEIPLGNCSILKTQPKTSYNFLPEFTLLSVPQALNEKKQFLKKYLIKGKEILDLDLTKFKFLKSNPKEIHSLDISSQYTTAKINFKKDLHNNVIDIKIKLKEKLKEELERIGEYYSNQIKEKDDEILVCQKKIRNMEQNLRHTFYERDADTLKRNIRDSEARLDMLKKRGYKERLKEEEEFHVNDEINKHTLVIENKLVNATIFYYPITTFSLVLTQKQTSSAKIQKKSNNNTTDKISKTIEISYDPLFKRFDFESLICESCNKHNLNEINLCFSGKHLVCKTCLKKCKACKK